MGNAERKQEIRKELLAARAELFPEEIVRRSARACADLVMRASSVFSKQGSVGVYYAIGNEVQLDAFICAAYEAGCAVSFPFMTQVEGADAELRMLPVSPLGYRAHGQTVLARVRHPFTAEELKQLEDQGVLLSEPVDLDLQVIPMVGFDARGMRIGYGKGCYDRYFASLEAKPPLVGVAFAEQECPLLPAEPHDVALPDIVIA